MGMNSESPENQTSGTDNWTKHEIQGLVVGTKKNILKSNSLI